MTQNQTLFAVLGIVLTGERAAEFIADHRVLMGLLCTAIFLTVCYSINRQNRKRS